MTLNPFEAIKLDTLKPRERIALAIAGVVIILSLLQLVIIEPLGNKVEYLEHRISRQEVDLQWMQQAAEKIIRLRESAAAGEGSSRSESLLIVVDRSAKKAGISQSVKRIEPVGEESVRVWIEEVAFNDLLRWLGDLRVRGVRGDSIAIEQRKIPGRVNTKATLKWS